MDSLQVVVACIHGLHLHVGNEPGINDIGIATLLCCQLQETYHLAFLVQYGAVLLAVVGGFAYGVVVVAVLECLYLGYGVLCA